MSFSGAVGGRVSVDLAEQGAEVTDVRIVTEQEAGDIAEAEARLLLIGRMLADVVVGHGTLCGDDAQAARGFWRIGGCGGSSRDTRG